MTDSRENSVLNSHLCRDDSTFKGKMRRGVGGIDQASWDQIETERWKITKNWSVLM